MSDQANAEGKRIEILLENWADAIRRHDLPAILAHHDRNIVMFDLPPPLQCKGIEAYEQTWNMLFRYHKPGTAFDFRELTITTGVDVAFAAAVMWCGPDSSSNLDDINGFLFRLTVGLRKIDGEWSIVHEHHSVPAMN
jgi:ketosteroid isomerase-like protein